MDSSSEDDLESDSYEDDPSHGMTHPCTRENVKVDDLVVVQVQVGKKADVF